MKTTKLGRWSAINIWKVRYIDFDIRDHIKTNRLYIVTVSVLPGSCLKIGRQVVSWGLMNRLNKAKCVATGDAIFLKVSARTDLFEKVDGVCLIICLYDFGSGSSGYADSISGCLLATFK